ncbi:unnamed protein product [Ranitomeya imitator]|uniref:Large ribosomal subunit protein bL9m n=1 Tax=Ranitomeya imitator TaxID=111125 RepID=A0ABN9ML05_9NEOB|nr:unnamed protein product [Ranitomeya imitator]
MLQVFIPGGTEDGNVIQVRHCVLLQSLKQVVYHLLESGRSIFQAEGHDCGLVQSEGCDKGRLLLRFWAQGNLPESPTQIHYGQIFGASSPLKQLLDALHWVRVRGCDGVEPPVVHAEPGGPILLWHENYRSVGEHDLEGYKVVRSCDCWGSVNKALTSMSSMDPPALVWASMPWRGSSSPSTVRLQTAFPYQPKGSPDSPAVGELEVGEPRRGLRTLSAAELTSHEGNLEPGGQIALIISRPAGAPLHLWAPVQPHRLNMRPNIIALCTYEYYSQHHPPLQGTVVVERWWNVPLAKKGEEPYLHPRRHRIYRVLEDTKHSPKDKMMLILTQNVHKLGSRGDTVLVDKRVGRNKLLAQGVAVYASLKIRRCSKRKEREL